MSRQSRVREGAALLDAHFDRWAVRVNPDRLTDISAILSQVFRWEFIAHRQLGWTQEQSAYDYGLAVLFGEYRNIASEYGFALKEGEADEEKALLLLWEKHVRERRAHY